MKVVRELLIHLLVVGLISLGLAQLTIYPLMWVTFPVLAPLLLLWPPGLSYFLFNAAVLASILGLGLTAYHRTHQVKNLHAMLGLYWSWNLMLLFWLVMYA